MACTHDVVAIEQYRQVPHACVPDCSVHVIGAHRNTMCMCMGPGVQAVQSVQIVRIHYNQEVDIGPAASSNKIILNQP